MRAVALKRVMTSRVIVVRRLSSGSVIQVSSQMYRLRSYRESEFRVLTNISVKVLVFSHVV